MTQTEALQVHRQLCDELHQLALEENRFLKEQRRLPEPAHLERKRSLIERLDASLAALRDAPPSRPGNDERRVLIENAREKILQVLHLDRENEQLMLRYTLSRPGHAPRAATMASIESPPASAVTPEAPPAESAKVEEPTAPVAKLSHLQRLYNRLR